MIKSRPLPSGAWTAYQYDYAGRRVMKATIGGQYSRYCYDGDQVIAEYDYYGVLGHKFICQPGI